MKKHRSRFEILMDVLIVFYTYKSLRMGVVIRKANLCNGYQRELIDLLIASGLLVLSNDNFLVLTKKGEDLTYNIVPSIKKAKELYNSIENTSLNY